MDDISAPPPRRVPAPWTPRGDLEAARRHLVWSHADTLLTGRAVARLIATVAWIVWVSVAVGWDIARFGLVTLGGVCLAMVHANGAWVAGGADWLTRQSWLPDAAPRWWGKLFVYPWNEAHINPVGVIEIGSMLAIGLATRHMATTAAPAADGHVTALSAQPVATVLVLVVLGSAVTNMTAHPVWHYDPPDPVLLRLRPGIPLLAAGAVILVVFDPSASVVQRAVVLAGSAALLPVGWIAARNLDGIHWLVGDLTGKVRRDALRYASNAVHDDTTRVKHRILRLAHASGDPDLLTAAEDLQADLHGLADRLEADRSKAYQTAAQIVLRAGRDWPVEIERDADPSALHFQDAQLAESVLLNLISNAARSSARHQAPRPPRVSYSITPGHVEINVDCFCGQPLPTTPPPGSTLADLRDRVADRDGAAKLYDKGGIDVVYFRWRRKPSKEENR